MPVQECYCCSGRLFTACCAPYIEGKEAAPTAETLMRSRYTAYATNQPDYLIATTAPATRKFHNKADISAWAQSNTWMKLEILFSSEDVLEFKAYYIDKRSQKAQVHHERSKFVRVEGKWFYLDFE